MINAQGLSLWPASKDMGLVESAARRWLSQLEAGQAGLGGIGKPITAGHQRICQLRGNVEISKKASVGSTGQRNMI